MLQSFCPIPPKSPPKPSCPRTKQVQARPIWMDEGDTLPEARVHGGCSTVGKVLGGRVLEDRVQMPSSALIFVCEVCETCASPWPALQLSLQEKRLETRSGVPSACDQGTCVNSDAEMSKAGLTWLSPLGPRGTRRLSREDGRMSTTGW